MFSQAAQRKPMAEALKCDIKEKKNNRRTLEGADPAVGRLFTLPQYLLVC